MRISIPAKIFAAFLSVLLVSACMALAIWYGFKGLNKSAEDLGALKDFQISLIGLENFNFGPEMRSQADRKTRLDAKFSELKSKTTALKTIFETLPPETAKELPLLEEQLEFFRKAYHELLKMQEEDEILHHKQHVLMETLALKLIDPENRGLLGDFSSMLYHWGRAYHDRDVDSIKGLNLILDSARERITKPETRELLNDAQKTLAKNYLNYLAMVEREDFLAGTSKRYVQLSNEALSIIEGYETKRQERLTSLVVGALLLSLAMTILYWVKVSAYITSYLEKSKELVNSVRKGEPGVTDLGQADDELGDMLVFIRQMGENLKETMASVRASEEKYRTLVENMDDWVWEADAAGKCVYSSPVGVKILSLPENEILGKSISELLCGTSGSEENTKCLALLSEGKSASGVLSHVTPSGGKAVALESSWRMVVNPDRKPSGFKGITRNVTERLALEADRRDMSLQLMHAQKMEAIGTLSGGVAHDFNNLLQSIGGYADILLKRGNLGEKDRETVKLLAQTAVSASRLTKQLLLFSSRVETRMEPVDLNECTARIINLLSRLIPKETVLTADLDPCMPYIMADQTQIEQILMNLIINASDAIGQTGSINITTREVKGSSGDPEHVILSVRDTGKGMPPETRERIFEPFFTTKEAGKGTGLGLAIVYGITKSHNGEIRCESEPGKGTLFEITFPATDLKPVKPAKEETVPVAHKPDQERKTILVVDDEVSILETSREILTMEGYNTLTAKSGEEALEIYTAGRVCSIDLIILDISMPGMGGEECFRKLRALNPDQAIVLASGYPDTITIDKSPGRGVDAFLKKPFRLRTLLETIRTVAG